MNKFFGLAIIASMGIFLQGCDALFEANLFKAFDTPVFPRNASGLSLTDIDDMAKSDTFFEQLAEDDAAKDSFIDRLDAIQADPASSPQDVQTAAILETDIYLQTTQAGEIVNNVLNLLSNMPTMSSSDDASILINGIMPENITKAEFTDIINAFILSKDAFDDYAGQIGLSNPDAPPSVNVGEMAMNAVISYMIASIEPPGGMTLADALYSLAFEGGTPLVTFPTNPLDTGSNLCKILTQADLNPDTFR